jgi:antirestriction protein ArdC
VQRGQRATYGIKWVERKQQEDDGRQEGEMTLRDLERRGVPIGFAVFNADQTELADGFDATPWLAPDRSSHGPDPIPGCAAFFEEIGATVVAGSPAYSPTSDLIMMPPLEAFDDAAAYYATSAHEHAHWTGHGSRLARDLSGRFGSDSYAAEELVAELAAAYVAAVLDVETHPRADHAQYLASWIRVLRSDSRALFRAATLAQAAADYLIAAARREQEATQRAAA